MLGKKYTAEFKLEKVREYLERVEKGEKISKADFAYENGLSDSTFNDWVIKYQKMGKGFANVTKQIALIGGNALEEAPKIVRYDGVANGELPSGVKKPVFQLFNSDNEFKKMDRKRRWNRQVKRRTISYIQSDLLYPLEWQKITLSKIVACNQFFDGVIKE